MIGYDTLQLYDNDASVVDPSHHARQRIAKRRRKQREQGKNRPTLKHGKLPTLSYVANPEYLISVFEEMKRDAGKAPGPDRLSYADFDASEIAADMRSFSKRIKSGNYRPGPARIVEIPKADGKTRELRLRNIGDRVVAGGLKRAIAPYFEKRFLPCSYGFRASPQKAATASESETFNTWRFLADFSVAIHHGLYVVVVDDIAKAFDNVDITRVIDIRRTRITNSGLLNLIEAVLRGDDPTRPIGIDQGSPISPLILNIFLDHVLDQPLYKEDPQRSYYRYADNIISAHRSMEEAHQTLDEIKRRLNDVDLTLKGADGPPVDLRFGTANALGFKISVKNGELFLEPSDQAWSKIRDKLIEAHEVADPTYAVGQIIIGWIQAYGPALGNLSQPDTLERIYQTAGQLGFHEMPDVKALEHAWNSAIGRWHRTREDALKRYTKAASVAYPADPVIDSGSATSQKPGLTPDAGGVEPQDPLEHDAVLSTYTLLPQPLIGVELRSSGVAGYSSTKVAALTSIDHPPRPISQSLTGLVSTDRKRTIATRDWYLRSILRNAWGRAPPYRGLSPGSSGSAPIRAGPNPRQDLREHGTIPIGSGTSRVRWTLNRREWSLSLLDPVQTGDLIDADWDRTDNGSFPLTRNNRSRSEITYRFPSRNCGSSHAARIGERSSGFAATALPRQACGMPRSPPVDGDWVEHQEYGEAIGIH